jgi:UDP-N-acetylmuramyl pentapeptide phosphotransferase/UDP-N-acetylglucosamine-1-phosphate transferase
VARGEHPERTPVYGGALMVGAMVVATVVTAVGVPAWVRIAVYLVALVAALVGFVLTFRDYG